MDCSSIKEKVFETLKNTLISLKPKIPKNSYSQSPRGLSPTVVLLQPIATADLKLLDAVSNRVFLGLLTVSWCSFFVFAVVHPNPC